MALWATAWITSLLLVFLAARREGGPAPLPAGQPLGPPPGDSPARAPTVPADEEGARPSLQGRGPSAGRTGSDTFPASVGTTLSANPTLAPVGRLTARAAALLAEGPSAHVRLARFLGQEVPVTGENAWVSSDDATHLAARRAWARFVVSQGSRWTDALVAALEDMCRQPWVYEDSLGEATFLVGELAALPAWLPPEELAGLSGTMREAVARWGTQDPPRPEHVGDLLEEVLAAWAPAVPPVRARELLRSGDLPFEEACALLESLRPHGVSGEDLALALTHLTRPGVHRVWRALQSAPHAIPPSALPTLDELVLRDAETSPYTDYAADRLFPYLVRSGRGGWSEARDFIQGGLARGGRAPERFAAVLRLLDPKPGREYVEWVLARYPLPPSVAAALRSAFGIP